MEKKGVRSQGKTRIGEEECRCKIVRMQGKEEQKRTDLEGRGESIPKNKSRREQMQKKEE